VLADGLAPSKAHCRVVNAPTKKATVTMAADGSRRPSVFDAGLPTITARSVERLRPQAAQIADQLLDGIEAALR
jgi:hypothetical protein